MNNATEVEKAEVSIKNQVENEIEETEKKLTDILIKNISDKKVIKQCSKLLVELQKKQYTKGTLDTSSKYDLVLEEARKGYVGALAQMDFEKAQLLGK